jgi:hypothetical protein
VGANFGGGRAVGSPGRCSEWARCQPVNLRLEAVRPRQPAEICTDATTSRAGIRRIRPKRARSPGLDRVIEAPAGRRNAQRAADHGCQQKLGVSTQLLAGADIFPALERGVIDATEFSMPMMDIKLGFHQIAKFNYFPGWHQQVSCSHLLMNKQAWDALPDQYKAMVEMAAGHQVMYTYAETEAMQFGVMQEMRDKYKVQVKRWPDDVLAAFEKAWMEVLQEESAKDPLFKRIADHYLDFRKQYAIWGDSQYMKASYVKKD